MTTKPTVTESMMRAQALALHEQARDHGNFTTFEAALAVRRAYIPTTNPTTKDKP